MMKIDLDKLEYETKKNESLDEFIKKIYSVFQNLKIDVTDKKIFYIRTKDKKGVIGIQICKDEELDNYLIYSYSTINRDEGYFLSIRTDISGKIYPTGNIVSNKLGSSVIDYCYLLEEEYNNDNAECSLFKKIDYKKKKTNILQRLFLKK